MIDQIKNLKLKRNTQTRTTTAFREMMALKASNHQRFLYLHKSFLTGMNTLGILWGHFCRKDNICDFLLALSKWVAMKKVTNSNWKVFIPREQTIHIENRNQLIEQNKKWPSCLPASFFHSPYKNKESMPLLDQNIS